MAAATNSVWKSKPFQETNYTPKDQDRAKVIDLIVKTEGAIRKVSPLLDPQLSNCAKLKKSSVLESETQDINFSRVDGFLEKFRSRVNAFILSSTQLNQAVEQIKAAINEISSNINEAKSLLEISTLDPQEISDLNTMVEHLSERYSPIANKYSKICCDKIDIDKTSKNLEKIIKDEEDLMQDPVVI